MINRLSSSAWLVIGATLIAVGLLLLIVAANNDGPECNKVTIISDPVGNEPVTERSYIKCTENY